MGKARIAISLTFAGIVSLTSACLNDRDSAVSMQRRMYEGQQVLTGWFDRNPPRYYQMRIERLEKKPKLLPNELDDLAVAYERLGESKQAMGVIDRKLKLEKPGYTYFANHGTFLVHDWLRSSSSDLKDARQAEKEIAKAIEINPDAHYGREGAQLEAIRWIIHLRTEKAEQLSLGEFMVRLTEESSADYSKLVEGLTGLVELGSAWESVDLFAAIAALAPGEPAGDVAHFRAKELLAVGKKPTNPEGVQRDIKRGVVEPMDGASKEAFDIMRSDAERRTKLRNAYMEERLAQGRHPDTHPDFWKEWKEPLRTPMLKPTSAGAASWVGPTIALSALVLVGCAIYAFLKGLRNGRSEID